VTRRRGREGKEKEIIKPIMRYLLKYLFEKFEQKIILKSNIIFKYLKYTITKYRLTLKDLNPFLDLTP
jgi:hypothetical protein